MVALTPDKCGREPNVDDGPDAEGPAGGRDVRVVNVGKVAHIAVEDAQLWKMNVFLD